MTRERRSIVWPEERRRLVVTDEMLINMMFVYKDQPLHLHQGAPWVFKVDGRVHGEYEYVKALAVNRGLGRGEASRVYTAFGELVRCRHW